jgi:hypothetical protein
VNGTITSAAMPDDLREKAKAFFDAVSSGICDVNGWAVNLKFPICVTIHKVGNQVCVTPTYKHVQVDIPGPFDPNLEHIAIEPNGEVTLHLQKGPFRLRRST